MPRELGAAEFKVKGLAILDSLEPEGIVITKHGRPVATVVPIASASADLVGCPGGHVGNQGRHLAKG